MLAHESRGHGHTGGEKLAFMRAEIDPAVDDLRTQHVRFDMVLDGVARSHFPDLLKLRGDGIVEVEEVKHDDCWRRDADYRRMVDAVAGICREVGWSYGISTARDVAPTPRVRDNIVAIQCERFVRYGASELIAVLAALRAGGGQAPLADLEAALDDRPGARSIVMGMMCHGHLALPLDARLDGAVVAEIRADGCRPATNRLA